MGPRQIPSSGLNTPLVTSLPANDETLELDIVNKIISLLKAAKSPVVLIDGGKCLRNLIHSNPSLTWRVGAIRNGVIEESVELIKTLHIPYFGTPMSKGGISETLGSFGGVYVGGASTDGVRIAVETADLVLRIGNYPVRISL